LIACPTLTKVVNAKAAISAEIALRLENWLGVENGGRADVWLAEQTTFDLYQARERFNAKVTLLISIAAKSPKVDINLDLFDLGMVSITLSITSLTLAPNC
jgi:plasmid maintenance system antidote protein VapI